MNGESGATVGVVTLNTTQTNAGTYASDSWSLTGAANYNNIGTTIQDVINQAVTTTSIVTSGSPAIYGQLVTFTVTVSSSGAPAPPGIVNILDGASITGTVTLSGGMATYSTFSIPPGTNSITVSN